VSTASLGLPSEGSRDLTRKHENTEIPFAFKKSEKVSVDFPGSKRLTWSTDFFGYLQTLRDRLNVKGLNVQQYGHQLTNNDTQLSNQPSIIGKFNDSTAVRFSIYRPIGTD